MAEDIDALRDGEGRLDRAALLRILPYGDAFLLLHRVERLDEESIEATWEVPTGAPWVEAHFTDLPIVPGVLVGESLAQAGTLLVRSRIEDQASKHVLGFQIDHALFSSPVRPGDVVRLEVRLDALRTSAAKLSGKARVGDRQVCRARLIVGIIDREALREQVDALPD